MKTKKKLIGLAGKARSGKDTLGKHLIIHHNFHRMAFADPLKSAMAATFGVAVEEFHCDKLKDEIEPHWNMTRRTMLQEGADALRGMFGQDLFIRRWLHAYFPMANSEHVVVTDVRSDAEARTIRDLGGLIIEVRRGNSGAAGEAAKHHTEAGISPEFVNQVLINDGEKVEAYDRIDQIIAETFHAT